MMLLCPKCGIELVEKWDGFECPKCEYWWHESIPLKEFMIFGEEE